MLDAVGAGHGEVDRLSARVGESPQARLRELGERLRRVAARVAEEDGTGAEAAASAEPLYQSLTLEGADEARGRALGEAGALRELADRRRLGRFDDVDEQLRGALDRLGSRGFGSDPTLWNICSKNVNRYERRV
ncbi:MAG: hypothetical protein WAL31_00560 [Gaiellaceae bacterium]